MFIPTLGRARNICVPSLLWVVTYPLILNSLRVQSSSLSIPGHSIALQLRVFHCKLGRLQKGILTQSETMSAFLTSTSMESERVAAHMQPLLQPVPLFLLQLHVKVSGAWGRDWTFIFNLLQVVISPRYF